MREIPGMRWSAGTTWYKPPGTGTRLFAGWRRTRIHSHGPSSLSLGLRCKLEQPLISHSPMLPALTHLPAEPTEASTVRLACKCRERRSGQAGPVFTFSSSRTRDQGVARGAEPMLQSPQAPPPLLLSPRSAYLVRPPMAIQPAHADLGTGERGDKLSSLALLCV